MASKLMQLRSKAVETSKFMAKQGCAYHKQLVEENKHYIENIPHQLSPSEPVSLRSRFNFCDILSYIGKYSGEQKELLRKFVSFRMKKGKRRTVRAIFDHSFHRLAQSEGDVIDFLGKAIENIKPICEVQRIKQSGGTLNVPTIIAGPRQVSLAMRWILEGAEERCKSKGTSLEESTFEEMLDAYNQNGIAHTKKKNLHKLAADARIFQNKKRR